jgi:hypothetical protein
MSRRKPKLRLERTDLLQQQPPQPPPLLLKRSRRLRENQTNLPKLSLKSRQESTKYSLENAKDLLTRLFTLNQVKESRSLKIKTETPVSL